MKFSERLWKTCEPIYQQIIQHPFNAELAEGTLDPKRFHFYMEQDAYYLISFSKALALIASRAVSSKMIHQFISFSLSALVVERNLQVDFLNSKKDNYQSIKPSQACLSYTKHLIATSSTGSLEEAVAAILPCFWIYREVGRHIAKNCTHTNPYIRWIETYSSQEFSNETDQAIGLLDELASHCSKASLVSMQQAFQHSALFEWYFWNDAYHMNIFGNSVFQPYSQDVLV